MAILAILQVFYQKNNSVKSVKKPGNSVARKTRKTAAKPLF